MKIIYLLSCIAFISSKAQVIHHQMISAQGTSAKLEDGMVITQTVGQSSVIGSFNNSYIKGSQGFQQVIMTKVFDNTNLLTPTIIKVYPIPFKSYININFSSVLEDEEITATIHDLLGKLVYSKVHRIQNQNIELLLETFPNATYLLTIYNSRLKYSAKIIKQ